MTSRIIGPANVANFRLEKKIARKNMKLIILALKNNIKKNNFTVLANLKILFINAIII